LKNEGKFLAEKKKFKKEKEKRTYSWRDHLKNLLYQRKTL